MSPKNITAEVLNKEIDIIAISDHNSAENVRAVAKATRGKPVVMLPGMEVCSSEEVHVLALFDSLDSANSMQSFVYDHLHGQNDPDLFGIQVIANEVDEVEGFQDKLLIGATDVPIEELVSRIHKFRGLAIASHIDRESFSVIGQLGFIPESLRFDALEISSNISDKEAQVRFSEYRHYSFVRNSDAHALEQIGSQTTSFMLEEPTLSEIAKALKGEDGRLVQA
jgi:hypothetical protein